MTQLGHSAITARSIVNDNVVELSVCADLLAAERFLFGYTGPTKQR